MNAFNQRWPPLAALLKQHASLGLLGLSSVSYFGAMIVARKTLEPDDLYFWNVLVTLVAMGFSFCFFGAEQLFLRFSTLNGARVSINSATLWLMGGALALHIALVALLSESYFFRLDMLALYPLVGMCVGTFVFVYNLMRIRKSFIAAQLAANGWKFTILGAILVAPLGNVELLITAAGLGLACAGTLALFWRNRSALEVNVAPIPAQWRTLFLGFAFSLFVLMLMNNADRLIITRYGSEAQFSEYVYLVSLLLLPFSLLSNYFGFKEMAYLKQTYDRHHFLRKTVGAGGLAAVLFVPWFGLVYTFQSLLEVPVSWSYAFPALLIVICRCSYSLLSTLFGLKGTPRQIHMANLLTLLAIGCAIAVILMVGVTINSILILLAAFWCSRVIIYAWFSARITEHEAHHAL